MKTNKRVSRKLIVILAVILVLAILAFIYVKIGFRYKNQFFPNTTVNGIDCSNKSVSEVEQYISKTLAPYQLELIERSGQNEFITGTDINFHPVFDGSLQRELDAQNIFAWPTSYFQQKEIKLETMFTYDEDKLQNVLNSLHCIKLSESSKPANAYLSDYIDGTGYEIIPEEEGAQVNASILAEALHNSIINLEKTISLEDSNCYYKPEIRADDETLVSTAALLNSSISAVITYEIGDNREVLDGSTIHNWITLTPDNQVVLDEAQAAAYVKSIASKYDTYGKARNFTTHYGSTVSLNRNELGWKINQAAETTRLLADIKSGSMISREPVFSKRAVGFGSDMQEIGGTYVEINLTAQHLFLHKNGSVIWESDFISGTDGLHDTPSGAYSVTYTQRNATLRGSDYAVPVDYWMPFNGNIGMHDAQYRSDFGGNYYRFMGSHGCINLPLESARTIFNNVKSGTPVITYRLPGTETAKFPTMEKAEVVVLTILGLDSTITLDSKSSINVARAAYNALSDEEKSYVRNYSKLEDAEAAYANLLAQQTERDKAAAQSVIASINAIGEVTLDSKSAIEAARNQYNALSDAAKQYVTNEDILRNAEAKLQELLSAA